jgi:preprotein translocase subunit SecG
MTILASVATVLFIILSALLIIIILLQTDKSAGMGILGGSSQSTFGSSTADVITKITTVMVALFMLGALGLAMLESYKAKSLEQGLAAEGAKGILEDADKTKETEQGPKEGPAADKK